MNIGMQLFLMLAVAVLIAATKYRYAVRTLIADWQEFQEWRADKHNNSAPAYEPVISEPLDTATIPGAGRALAHPPTDLGVALHQIRVTTPPDQRYTVPLGWFLTSKGQPECITASFVGDVNHILITGRSDAGKDNAAMGMLLSLALTHSPEEVQIAIIDGKGGMDWANWQNKQHVAHLAMDMQDIVPVMQALKAERERRTVKLRNIVSKWDEYTGTDLPLLVVYVAELALLQSAIGKTALGDWLTTELVSSRALGIRYIIASQDVSGLDTTWRRQITLFMAGVQNAQSADMPNTSLYTKDLEALGAIPPSQLPGGKAAAGVFTCIQDRVVSTVRTTLLAGATRQNLLARLPNKSLHQAPVVRASDSATADTDILLELLNSRDFRPSHASLPAGALHAASNGATSYSDALNEATLHASPALHASPIGERDQHLSSISEALPMDVPEVEAQRIIAAAKTASSRREVCQALYNTTGGKKYEWVKQVCNARGLLGT